MSGYTPPFFIEKFSDNANVPLAGGLVYFYTAGSTTIQKNIYSDISLTIPLTQPLQLDGSGNAQQYFMEAGQYKILIKSSTGTLIYTRDHIEGVASSSASTNTVKTTAGDTSADYLANKFQDSPTVTWSTVSNSGAVSMVATADPANILDYKVKAQTSDTVPGYLDSKIASTATISLSINGSNQVTADLIAANIMYTTGGIFTGPVTFVDVVTAVDITATSVSATTLSGNTVNALSLNAINTYTQDLQVTSLASTGDSMAIIDSDGVIGAVAGSPFMAKYDDADLAAGYLDTKIQAGNGILINTTSDITNGTVMHINAFNTDSAATVLGKASNISVTTNTPTSILTGIAYPQYLLGSFTIPAGYTQEGYAYRTEITVSAANHEWLLDLVFATVGGSGSIADILMPVGANKIVLDVIFTSVAYGTFPIVTYTIYGSSAPYLTVLEPQAFGTLAIGAFDPALDISVEPKIHTSSLIATISATLNLWKL